MKRLFMLMLMVCAINTAFSQTIIAAEYFFDHDPGAGKGAPISIGASGTVVKFSASIPANLTPGFHWLGVRTEDSDGKWGFFERRNFYLTATTTTDMPAITAAEYFFDHDAGPGHGSPLIINSPGNTISQTFSIPVPSDTSAGKHLLSIRVKDQAGHWGLFEKDSINVVASTSSITCPGNITVSATAGQCSAIVNNIDPTVSSGSAYTYTLTDATIANGTGYCQRTYI